MNITRIGLAALGAFVAYFVLGGIWAAVPQFRNEFRNYPNVYRSQESMMSVMPVGMISMLFAIVALTVLYALLYQRGPGIAEGARFGALIGVFAIGSFVVHNYVNLRIGLKLTIEQAVIYFLQWVLVGIVIGLIYRPQTLRQTCVDAARK